MACNGVKQPLVSAPLDRTPQTARETVPRRRRFRRSKSDPLVELLHTETNSADSLPRSASIFDKVHPSIGKVAIFLAAYLGVGTLCLYLVRHQIQGKKTDAVLDAVYFCIVTMTTVGYGDLVPKTVPAKLLVCAFVFTGMALVGLVLSKAADYLVEKQETLLIKTLRSSKRVGQTEILRDLETNGVRYKCLLVLAVLLVLMGVGTVFLATVEKMDIVDAFYCVCSTVTTLGYGDKSFSTKAGRCFAVFWILTSTICLAQFFLCLAEVNTENRRRALVNWVLTRRVTMADLEAADFDDDGVVGAAEFIIYKLKEMGKINQDDISPIMEEFEDLDVDQSATLSASDILLAQSSANGRCPGLGRG